MLEDKTYFFFNNGSKSASFKGKIESKDLKSNFLSMLLRMFSIAMPRILPNYVLLPAVDTYKNSSLLLGHRLSVRGLSFRPHKTYQQILLPLEIIVLRKTRNNFQALR